MYIKKFIYILFFVFISINIFGIEKYVDIDMIKKATPPKFLDSGILFTLNENFGYSIYIRTNLDGWQKNWYFKKNFFGVWCLFLPYDRSMDQFLYKLNVNGFWEVDPANPLCIEDKYGVPISVMKLPKEVYYTQNNPVIEDIDNKVKKIKFKYFNPDAKEVNIVLSIDNWNHYTNSMVLNDDGYWEFEMYFKTGRCFYFFLVDGKKVVDKENPNKKWLDDFKEVSVIDIK